MKLSTALLIPVVLGLGQTTGKSQSYLYSGPISAWTEVDLSPDGGMGDGGAVVSFGAITDTLNYNAAAQSLQETGSITVNQPSVSFDIEGSFYSTPGSGSAMCIVGNNGSFSFDNTYQSEGNGLYFTEIQVPVTGSGTYNGQAFAGSWDIDIPVFARITAATPNSLDISEFTVQGAEQANAGVAGLSDGTSDGTYYFSWSLDSTAAVTAVPEPNSLALLVMGMAAATAVLRRR